MDLQIQTETFNVDDLTWLAAYKNLNLYPATMSTAFLVEATHYPDGYIKPGLAIGLFTGGAEINLWSPWVQDGGAGNNGAGEEVLGGLVFSGFQVRKNAAGAVVAPRTVGAILLPEDNNRVIVSKLPAGLLADDTTANTPTAGELQTAGFSVLNLGV